MLISMNDYIHFYLQYTQKNMKNHVSRQTQKVRMTFDPGSCGHLDWIFAWK